MKEKSREKTWIFWYATLAHFHLWMRAPGDPLIYRFHELVQTYGTTWKVLTVDALCSDRQPKPDVPGVEVDAETRCLHYHSALDIVALIKSCRDSLNTANAIDSR